MAAASHRSRSEDRMLVMNAGRNWILCLCDGAGGMSGGANAADLLVHRVQRVSSATAFDVNSPEVWSTLLAESDAEIRQAPKAGETTGIVMALTPTTIIGASCGDSEAWLFSEHAHRELTCDQVRKPRLGTGLAQPRSFHAAARGTLVIASDGLFSYVKPDDVAREVFRDPGLTAVALRRVLEFHYRVLPDDVAIIVAHTE